MTTPASAEQLTMQICVVGVGNSWASDDGVGPEAVRRLQVGFPGQARNGRNRADVAFFTLSQPAVELIDILAACDILIVIDAVANGSVPGTMYREVWQSGLIVSRGFERSSSHGLGVGEVLELAANLDLCPAQVILWGIEAGSTEPGNGLTPKVAAAMPKIVDNLREELKKQLLELTE